MLEGHEHGLPSISVTDGLLAVAQVFLFRSRATATAFASLSSVSPGTLQLFKRAYPLLPSGDPFVPVTWVGPLPLCNDSRVLPPNMFLQWHLGKL